jgi:hypothetical protein
MALWSPLSFCLYNNLWQYTRDLFFSFLLFQLDGCLTRRRHLFQTFFVGGTALKKRGNQHTKNHAKKEGGECFFSFLLLFLFFFSFLHGLAYNFFYNYII